MSNLSHRMKSMCEVRHNTDSKRKKNRNCDANWEHSNCWGRLSDATTNTAGINRHQYIKL